MIRIILGLMVASSLARADSLSDLRTALLTTNGRDPLSMAVTFEVSNRSSDDKSTAVAKVTAHVEEGPTGLTIKWPREIMEVAVAEQVAQSKDRNVRTPTRTAMDGLNATALNDYLHAGEQLLRVLGEATLLSEEAVTWQGHPARLLSLRVTPALSEKDKKYVKEIEMTVKIWLDAAGWPLAAEHSMHLRGRALLVINFEQTEHQEFRYERVNGRLVTRHHEKAVTGSGAGESGQSKTVATLELEKL
jgi:hypothetical protein